MFRRRSWWRADESFRSFEGDDCIELRRRAPRRAERVVQDEFLINAQHARHLARVRRQDCRHGQIVEHQFVFGEEGERGGIEYDDGARELRQNGFHQAHDRRFIHHAGTDEHGLHFVRMFDDFFRGGRRKCAGFEFRQRNDVRLRDARADLNRNARGRGDLQFACTGAQRGGRRQHHCARHLPRAADDKHTPALFLISCIIRLRQTYAAQDGGRQICDALICRFFGISGGTRPFVSR
jgi:hypothetical protein